MAAAGLAVSPLARLNPWLSACDLEEEGAGAECGSGQAACSGGGAETLAGRDVPALCAMAASERARRLAELRLRACCERSPASALDRSARADVLAGGERCDTTLRDLLALDAMVARVHCDFVGILHRYDCDQSYSVHTCNECQVSLRRVCRCIGNATARNWIGKLFLCESNRSETRSSRTKEKYPKVISPN
ncbi:unnamed protein product [Leptosia nina]|uniref:Uncharacterized protein n=1 Tax=Leptosia nina TaxID=320188 RepID=A0AAV1JG19_9NEOP